jgi:hypothetical protein
MKHAAKDGWKFVVFTQDTRYPVIEEKSHCDFLLSEIPTDSIITRVANPFSGTSRIKHLGQNIFGKSSIPWGLSVFMKIRRFIKTNKPEMVFVNTPPFTNVAIGFLLSKLYGIPLVLDIKDDWVGSAIYQRKGKFIRSIERWFEKEVITTASAVITVTQASYQTYCNRYSSLEISKKLYYLPNGGDLEEYQILNDRIRCAEGKRFRLVTAASGYRPDYRDLTPLLQTLEQFCENNLHAREQIEIEFLGEDPDPLFIATLQKILPQNQIYFSGVFNREALVERLWKADLFFLVQPKGNTTAISGTLYEYWATGKAPVLLFSESGASSDLVLLNKLGQSFYFTQIKESAAYLESVFKNFINHQNSWIEKAGIEEYDRQKISKKMISLWWDVIRKPGATK